MKVVAYIFFSIILFYGCVYTSTKTKEVYFFIEVEKGIDGIQNCITVNSGTYNVVKNNKIFKVILNEVRGGKTIGLFSKDVNGLNSKRLFFHNCKNSPNNSFLRMSFNDIVDLPSYKMDTMLIYKVTF